MGMKLAKSAYPSGHGPNDFSCFGPPAVKDGEFSSCKIADLGCFNQEQVDSNKYYVAEICKSKINSGWYVYFEWGRTGASSPSFQFVQCSSESDAQEEFVDQLMSKNAKRGEWTKIGNIRTLRAKAGKDCYLVRPMAKRSVGLPDGRSISTTEPTKSPVKSLPVTKSASTIKIDPQTIALMRDLNVATVQYTRTSIVGGAVPAQPAIDEARTFLTEAEKLVLKIGPDLQDQLANSDLKQVTYALYSRVPKVKPVNAPESTWILSSNNILSWRQDLDAFEAALYSQATTPTQQEHDPFDGMKLDMEWISPSSDLGKFLHFWWPKASGNRHAHVGGMQIKNLWRVSRHEDVGKIDKWQSRVLGDKVKISDRPFYQPSERSDLPVDKIKQYFNTNTPLLFHGTRTVNVTGILRKSWLLPRQLVGVSMNGAAFGPGSYWADDWRKSDGYTSRSGSYYSRGDGGINSRHAFMFAADVVLGNPWVCPYAGGYTAPKPGPRGEKTHHIYAKMGQSGVMNNEFITFDANQCAMRYLCEYDTR